MSDAQMKEKEYTTENLKQAKRMLKEYKDAKVRVIMYPKKRPTFFRQMKVDLTEYERCGIVNYDDSNEGMLDIDDWFYLHQYVSDMEAIWFVEKCIGSMPEGKRKQIAEDAFMKGLSTAELEAKYGLKERSIQWQKDQVARRIAKILL